MKLRLNSALRRLALLSLLALAPAAHAQVNLSSQLPLPSNKPPVREGLLGTSYLLLDLSKVEQRKGIGENYGPTVGVNFAPNEIADITTSLTYAKQRDWPDSGNVYQFGVDCTLHMTNGHVKPFVVGGVAYQFTRTPLGQDLGLWNLGAGIEIAVAPKTAVTVKAVNVGSFSKGVSNPWQYSIGANYWIHQDVALTAGVTFVETNARAFSLGARWAF